MSGPVVKHLAKEAMTGGGALARRISLPRPASVHLQEVDLPPAPAPAAVEILEIIVLTSLEVLPFIAEEKPFQAPFDAADRIRARHHAIARLLAAGNTPAQIAELLNCSAQTVRNLERSPAFAALLAEYMGMMDAAAVDQKMRLVALSGVATDALTDRIINSPGDFKPQELVEVAKMGLDRTGFGPSSTSKVTLNGALSAADIRAFTQAPPQLYEATDADWTEVGRASVRGPAVRAVEEASECSAEAGALVPEDDAEGGGEAGGGLVGDLGSVLGPKR